ncbi:hypothetical protein K9O30_13025 [Clostridium bowmanii]|nr:hypothetical protein [Clostridium bowmanii]MBU3189937.1 hypothetical protein [Clostridium bowmanii]MCA1074629.1 hypothetical protein [Clostridium bowmanii]
MKDNEFPKNTYGDGNIEEYKDDDEVAGSSVSVQQNAVSLLELQEDMV